MFIAGQPRPHPKGMGHRRPQSFLGPATYDQLFWRRATKFGVEHVGSSVLLGGKPRLHPNGVWLQHLQHCWDPHKCAQTVWPRPTKFGTITHVGSSVFLGASHAPITGEGPSVPSYMGSQYEKFWETTTQCMLIELDVTKTLARSPRMLTRVVFSVSNLLVITSYYIMLLYYL